MSELISGKEAKLTWANGEDVEFRILSSINHRDWKNIYDASNGFSIQEFDSDEIDFRLKPRTITINGVELEKPKNIEKPTVTSILLCFNSEPERNVFLNTLMNRNF